jgi:hypothetical protein
VRPEPTLSDRMLQTKPACRLNSRPRMYIVRGNNIFARELTFVTFTRLIDRPPVGMHDRLRMASTAIRRTKTSAA